jgi:hypothetical protein
MMWHTISPSSLNVSRSQILSKLACSIEMASSEICQLELPLERILRAIAYNQDVCRFYVLMPAKKDEVLVHRPYLAG